MKSESLSEVVDPWIGTLPVMLEPAIPEVLLPHGMMGIAPVVGGFISDTFLAESIDGFGFGYVTRGPGLRTRVMPVAGTEGEPRSACDPDFVDLHPHAASYMLQDPGIRVEYTPTQRAVLFRFTFPQGTAPGLVFDIHPDGAVTDLAADTICGYEKRPRHRMYIHAQWNHASLDRIAHGNGKAGARIRFGKEAPREILLKIGISYIDADQARANLLREIPDWDFAAVRGATQAAWDDVLGRIRVEGGTRAQRRIFYTALYRCVSRMRNHDEYGRYYSPADEAVHPAVGRDFYMHDWSWDTHRTAHPLQALIEPERRNNIVQSYVRMFEQSGWLPTFPTLSAGAGYAMVGFPCHAVVLDAYRKGYRGFDVGAAYAGMRHNATARTRVPPHRAELHTQGPLDRFYETHGYMPALREGEEETDPRVTFNRQSVSVTLEHAYSDWCVSEMARELGHADDARLFGQRAGFYRNVFRPDIGFMAPKDANGAWIEPFDPIWSGGQGGRHFYAECNAWVYTFSVPHDPDGLARLFGGEAGLCAKLDALFNTHISGGPRWRFFGQWPDMTGLIGMYSHGNEPAFHIPYLYNHAGAPWRGQKRLRQIMDLCYADTPQGLCGDDDQGALSTWYLFSAMGFYPLCPGRASYEIGSPIFDRVGLDLGQGRRFTVEAPGVSSRAKYVARATLDGRVLDRPRFDHDAAMTGNAVLRLEMSERPV